MNILIKIDVHRTAKISTSGGVICDCVVIVATHKRPSEADFIVIQLNSNEVAPKKDLKAHFINAHTFEALHSLPVNHSIWHR